ncbi:MAG: PucR family transcriptional regulator ligand-binding domain-containing protein [Firmicutes bacterium]|nr:PucR family transcriptional regulator ligand-binding domain-containing protein [Bacillota bacterium]
MITVQDVLQRDSFRRAQLVAGIDGLGRPIHWVHVGEVPELGQFLHGHELVLATGVSLGTAAARTRYLTGLIDAQASGLVLELGGYLPDVPEDMIVLANRHAFPIIVFKEPVRFLDLSQDINSLVISQHHRVMDDLETLSLKIRQALLNTEGPERLLAILTESIQRPALYLPRDDGEPAIWAGEWPTTPGPFESIALHPEPVTTPEPLVRQTVMVFEKPMGDLLVKNPGQVVDERVYLALDRTAAALAQDFIRTESLDRRRRREEAALLEPLLFDEDPAPHHIQRFRSRYLISPDLAYRVMVMDKVHVERLRPRLRGMATLLELDQTDRLVLVALAPRKKISAFPDALRTLTGPQARPIGISGMYSDPANMHQAFVEANDAALAAHYLNRSPLAYEELGLYRWILGTPRQQLERWLVAPELGPILAREDKERLLQTLEVLLAHIDSKQSASHVLGIHRQTLYARIRTLSDLLGEDFLAPDRRLALGAALVAYRFLTLPPAP